MQKGIIRQHISSDRDLKTLFEIYLGIDLNIFNPEIGLRPHGHHGLFLFG